MEQIIIAITVTFIGLILNKWSEDKFTTGVSMVLFWLGIIALFTLFFNK